jgi:hypothetical protein
LIKAPKWSRVAALHDKFLSGCNCLKKLCFSLAKLSDLIVLFQFLKLSLFSLSEGVKLFLLKSILYSLSSIC